MTLANLAFKVIFPFTKSFLTRNIVNVAGNYLWQGTFKTLQALFFFLIPPFSKFGTEDCPPPTERGGGGVLILCIHNIVHVNCRPCPYFFPKQTGCYFCYYCIIVIKIITIIIAITMSVVVALAEYQYHLLYQPLFSILINLYLYML